MYCSARDDTGGISQSPKKVICSLRTQTAELRDTKRVRIYALARPSSKGVKTSNLPSAAVNMCKYDLAKLFKR